MRKPLLFGFFAFLLLGVRAARADETDDDDLRPDVLACEEAVKHLADCCPKFDPKALSCTYLEETQTDCDFSTTTLETPALNEDESACILATSCALMPETVCARAQAARVYVNVSGDQDGPESPLEDAFHPPVCP